MATIQRNALVAPFNVSAPLIDPEHIRNTIKGKVGISRSGVPLDQTKWLQSVATGINATVQITANIPASSASPGQPGTVAFNSNWLYICVGLNIWRRIPLSSF